VRRLLGARPPVPSRLSPLGIGCDDYPVSATTQRLSLIRQLSA
jgi:hypothetical protein